MERPVNDNTLHRFELDNHLVLLREGADRVHVLNPLAKYIWDSLEVGTVPEFIAKEIAQNFAISQAQALQDVTNAIDQWSLELSKLSLNVQQSIKSAPTRSIPQHWKAVTEIVFRFPRFLIRVRFATQGVTDYLKPMLAHLVCSWTGQTDHTMDLIVQGNKHFIVIDGEITEIASSAKDVAVLAFREIAELACRRENWLVILHAAGVAWQGSGIIFPALGGSGKTTLTAGLIHKGFQYINDDVIPIERDSGRLVPIPMSLCIKSGAWPVLQHLYPALNQSEIFGRNNLLVKYLIPPVNSVKPLSSTPCAKYLIASKYQKSAPISLQTISSAEGLQAIIEGESLLRLPLRSQDIKELIAWVKPLRCYRLSYGELTPAVEAIGKLVS